MFARICLALATWLCVVPPSQAATLFSDSFESPDTTGRVTNSPAGWVATRTDKTGINDASISGKTGVQFAFLDDYPNTGLHDGSLTTTSSILSSNLTAWVNYTLTCDVAVGGSGAAGAIDLLAGTNVIASVTNKPSANNTFAATAALPSSTSKARIGIIPTDSHPYLGQPLSIRLRHVAGAWNHDVMFDNLVLDATDTSSDTNAPTPDAMLWHGGPVASANTSITMTAAVASDPNRVQYMFTNTVNGNCSGWIDANVWTDTGLTDGVSYIYKVKARDNSANYNETAWSDEAGATASAFVLLYDSFESPPHADVTSSYATNSQGWVRSGSGYAGLHDEAAGTFITPYGSQAAYVYDNAGTLATKYTITNMGAVLEVGTQYRLSFNAAAENGGSAQYGVDLLAGTNVIATASGTPGTNDMTATSVEINFTPVPDHVNLGETIGVRLRKPYGAWNGGHIVYDNVLLIAADTADDLTPPQDPLTWLEGPVAIANYSVSMIADAASDPNGVQYFFTNTVNGNVSGWQSSPGWTDSGLSANTTYRYKYKLRDNSSNLNESNWSPEESVMMVPGTLFYDSFEAPPHADVTSAYGTNSQGWVRSTTLSGAAGLHDEGAGTFVTPYGSQAAFVYDNVGTLETRYTTTGISAVLEAGITYTITFNAASENGGNAQYGVDLLAGTNVIASATGAPGNDDVSATSVTITYVAKEGDSLLGNTIAIRLRKPYGEWSAGHIVYDNVRLMALPSGYSPASDGGGVSYDFVAAPLEVTVDGYVGYLNAMTNGELSVDGGEVSLVTTSNLLCLTTDANADAYVSYDSGAAIGSRFSSVTDRGDHPMIFVSWFGAAAYCNWKSSVEGLDAVYNPAGGWSSVTTETGYRLPTEAEWYKAAAWNPVAGRFHAYGTSSDAITTNDANFLNSGDAYEGNAIPTTPVGSYAAVSPYVLFDMSGNVGEWCNELYSGSDAATDPHVIRGGGWGHPAGRGKSSARTALKPGQPADSVGFRVFKTVRWE